MDEDDVPYSTSIEVLRCGNGHVVFRQLDDDGAPISEAHLSLSDALDVAREIIKLGETERFSTRPTVSDEGRA